MSAIILKNVSLAVHEPTGRTRHTFGGVNVGRASSLRIIQYDDDPGFYLIHVDASGQEIADTYHETIEEAMTQAEWEYGVKPEEWQVWTN